MIEQYIRLMIIVTGINDFSGALRAYTGVIHENKQDALEEYLDAGKDPEVAQAFIMLVG